MEDWEKGPSLELGNDQAVINNNLRPYFTKKALVV
jgi:hypothetical protein